MITEVLARPLTTERRDLFLNVNVEAQWEDWLKFFDCMDPLHEIQAGCGISRAAESWFRRERGA
jgi:hypothetical protein